MPLVPSPFILRNRSKIWVDEVIDVALVGNIEKNVAMVVEKEAASQQNQPGHAGREASEKSDLVGFLIRTDVSVEFVSVHLRYSVHRHWRHD